MRTDRTGVMDLRYWELLADGYRSMGKPLPQQVAEELAAARAAQGANAKAAAAQQEAEVREQEEAWAKVVKDWWVYEDCGWSRKGKANYRGAHTIRALAIFSGRSVDTIHAELLGLFDAANAGRKARTQKYLREQKWLSERTEVPNWLVRNWCEAEGLTCTFSKAFKGKGIPLRPGNVPDDALLLLTKDWVTMRGGKIVSSWCPLWHDHRAVNGVWIA
jgi:hypothetical protein